MAPQRLTLDLSWVFPLKSIVFNRFFLFLPIIFMVFVDVQAIFIGFSLFFQSFSVISKPFSSVLFNVYIETRQVAATGGSAGPACRPWRSHADLHAS